MTPPYASDIRAKGWRFELDYEKIDQSDTWGVAGEVPMARPALLMLWLVAWKQEPCGSLPADENVIRAKCGIPAKQWPAMRDVLMRGWQLADDGRLYHDTVTKRVLEMLDYRAKAAKRKHDYRERMQESQGSHAGQQGDGTGDTKGTNDTGTGTGTGTKEKETSEAIASAAAAAQTDRAEAVFTLGLPLLMAAGVTEPRARSFLGRLRKFNGDQAVVLAIDRCAKANAAQPVEFLQGCLKTSAVHINRQEALEESNRAVGEAWVKEMRNAA